MDRLLRTAPPLVAMVVLTFVAASGASAQGQSANHPRLFFTAEDLPALRARAQREPYRSMLAAAERVMEHSADPGHLYDYSFYARHLATRYVVTGDARYAERAREVVARITADERFLDARRANALTRSAFAINVALAYDWCYPAWDDATRREVSRQIKAVGESLMQSGGSGWPGDNQPGSNWHGVRFATAGLCFLATDEPGVDRLLDDAYRRVVNHFRANLGTGNVNGLNPEGIGYLTYPSQHTAPFVLAMNRLKGRDVRDEVPPLRLTMWWYYVGALAIDGDRFDDATNHRGLRADFTDDHPNWGREGEANLAFGMVPPQYLPGMRWMYDRLSGQQGDGLFSTHRAGGIWHLLYYPEDVEPQNPADVWGLTWIDHGHGRVMFRNRYEDENDIVVQFNARRRIAQGGHQGPDGLGIRILGLGAGWVTGGGRYHNDWIRGQSTVYAEDPNRFTTTRSTLGEWVGEPELRTTGDGQASARMSLSTTRVRNHHRSILVDYAGAEQTGAAAVFLVSDTSDDGEYWRLNTPGFNRVELRPGGFVITSPDGDRMIGHVLFPADARLRTGSLQRGSSFMYRGQAYDQNHWIDIHSPGCEFLVALTLVEKDAPVPAVAGQRHLHGVTARVGSLALAWHRQRNELFKGDAATGTDIARTRTPLTPRGLGTTVLSDRHVRLHWTTGDLGAGDLLVQRRSDDGAWQDLATVDPAATSFEDAQAQPATDYEYRLLAANAHGRGEASEAAVARTMDPGYRLYVEDFAPRPGGQLPAANALGHWRSSPASGRRYELSGEEGSSRNAASLRGFMQIPSTPIRASKAIYIEGIRVDLSGDSAAVGFDYLTQATMHFSVVLKLADGRWIRGGGALVSSPEWQHVEFRIAGIATARHSPSRWHLADPAALTTGAAVEVTEEDLADIRGIGIWSSWPINNRWARIDQVHLRARDFRRE